MNSHHHAKTVVRSRSESAIVANKVIKNTYILLSLSLVFSAATAFIGVKTNAVFLPPMMTIIIYFGLFFLVNSLRNSALGILAVFALTGFLGYTAAPMVNAVLTLENGSQIVAAALGLTGVIFFALSGYALITKKDFSYLGSFLVVGITVVFVASLIGIFMPIPALQLAISSGFVLISAGYILFQTSQLVRGGERNYIVATVTLYVQIYNLFISLLHILSLLSGRK